jgi:hypothetical protein
VCHSPRRGRRASGCERGAADGTLEASTLWPPVQDEAIDPIRAGLSHWREYADEVQAQLTAAAR